MRKIKEILANLFHSDTFLKVLAVLLAVSFWFYIVTFADNTSSKTYQDVPVTFAYEGTVPYNNGLMPLVTSRSYKVSVEVSGQRVDLLNFSKEDLYVYFDFSRITEAGTYKVPLVVSSNDPNVTAIIKGDDQVSMQFTESASTEISLTLRKSGDYAPGYEEINRLISPKTISVQGPKDVIEKIKYAEVQYSASNQRESISFLSDINLLAEDKSYIDRTYVTMSSTTANVEIELAYREALKVVATPVNNYGGNEESYVSVTCSPSYVVFQGDEELFTTGTLMIGDIHLEDIKTKTSTKTYKIFPPEGLICIDDVLEIEVTIDTGDSEIRSVRIPSSILQNCHFRNLPEGKKATVDANLLYVVVRGLPFVFENPNVTTWSYYVDFNDTPNEDGQYPLHVVIPSDIPAGLLSQVYVDVLLEDIQ